MGEENQVLNLAAPAAGRRADGGSAKVQGKNYQRR